MRMLRGILGCVAVLVLSACSTKIDVRKVKETDRKTPGIRYALPKPVLTVTPQADGGVVGAWDYLPDADNTYAIEASSVWASHKLEVAVADGLLTELTYNPDATAVATGAVDSLGAATKTILDDKIKERETERTDAETAARAWKTARDALANEAARVEKELAIARAKETAQKEEGDKPENISATRIEIAKLEAELIIHKQRLAEFESTPLAVRDKDAPTLGGQEDKRTPPDAFPTVFGPVSYRIEEKVDSQGRPVSVRLVPVFGPGGETQTAWPTSKIPPPRGSPPQEPAKPPGPFLVQVVEGPDPVVPLWSRTDAALKRLETAEARRVALEAAERVDLEILTNAILTETDARLAYEDAHQPVVLLTTNRAVKAIASVKAEAGKLATDKLDKLKGEAWRRVLLAPSAWKLTTANRVEFTFPAAIRVKAGPGEPEERVDLPDGPYELTLAIQPAPVAGALTPDEVLVTLTVTVAKRKPETTPAPGKASASSETKE